MDEIDPELLESLSRVSVGTLNNQWWRLCNLYPIQPKDGPICIFKPWGMQKKMYEARWYRNVVLKVRQIGSSTFWALYILDAALFCQSDQPLRAAIIAQTREDAKELLMKCKFAFDNMDENIKTILGVKLIEGQRGGVKLKFSNGSEIRSGITARGRTLDILMVSEFGKLAAAYPAKAREITTGAMEATRAGGMIIVETTAEGYDGFLFDMVERAAEIQESRSEVLTQSDYNLHFYPWHEQDEYRDENPIDIPEELQAYFEKLRIRGIFLSKEQKFWYVRQAIKLKGDVKREYPSYREEAFQSTGNALYLAAAMAQAEDNRQIGDLRHNPDFPVFCSWDLGSVSAIWIYQYTSMTSRNYVDFLEAESADFAVLKHFLDKLAAKHGYQYGGHVFPHDGNSVQGMTATYQAFAEAAGLENIHTLKSYPHDYQVRLTNVGLSESYFDAERTQLGRKRIMEYRRKYDRVNLEFMDEPNKNRASHGAEAFMASMLFDARDVPMATLPGSGKPPAAPPPAKKGFFGWRGKGKTSRVQTSSGLETVGAPGFFRRLLG